MEKHFPHKEEDVGSEPTVTTNGVCNLIGRGLDCESKRWGFDSPRTPQLIGRMAEWPIAAVC